MGERNSPGPQSGQTKDKLDGWQKPPKGKRRLGFWHGEYMSLADANTLWAGPIGVGQTEQDWMPAQKSELDTSRPLGFGGFEASGF